MENVQPTAVDATLNELITVQLYIATLQIRLIQCPYLSTKVTSLLRSLWPSPMGDRYIGVRL